MSARRSRSVPQPPAWPQTAPPGGSAGRGPGFALHPPVGAADRRAPSAGGATSVSFTVWQGPCCRGLARKVLTVWALNACPAITAPCGFRSCQVSELGPGLSPRSLPEGHLGLRIWAWPFGGEDGRQAAIPAAEGSREFWPGLVGTARHRSRCPVEAL